MALLWWNRGEIQPLGSSIAQTTNCEYSESIPLKRFGKINYHHRALKNFHIIYELENIVHWMRTFNIQRQVSHFWQLYTDSVAQNSTINIRNQFFSAIFFFHFCEQNLLISCIRLNKINGVGETNNKISIEKHPSRVDLLFIMPIIV